MAILKLPAKSYLEGVDRAERALMQVGVFRGFNISKGNGYIVLYINDEFVENPEEVKRIYHSYEPPSA